MVWKILGKVTGQRLDLKDDTYRSELTFPDLANSPFSYLILWVPGRLEMGSSVELVINNVQEGD